MNLCVRVRVCIVLSCKKERMFYHLKVLTLKMYMEEGNNASRMPWPKLASRYALKSGCRSQQNLPAAGPDVKLKPQKPPPIFSSGVNKGSGHLPGSSA